MKYTAILSEADVQSIINGREVNKVLPNGKELIIRQSYLKDVAAPVIKDRYIVTDSVMEEQLEHFRASVQNTFRPGG